MVALKSILKNKTLFYVFSRYATYATQFVNGLFIAIYLGPYYLGVWGFINLVIQYITQFNLGIANSVNAIGSVHKNKEEYFKMVVGTAITMLIILSAVLLIILIISQFYGLRLGDSYGFNKFEPIVIIIAFLGYFNTQLTIIFRIFGKIFEIIFSQSIFPVAIFVIIFFTHYRGLDLLWCMVVVNLITSIFSFLLFISKTPIKIKPSFIWRLVKLIQRRGWYFFIYNASFYFIVISLRSIVSGFYSVQKFGYFTFAFAFANAIIMLFQSISFLIFPKIINRFATNNNHQISILLEKLRKPYISFAHASIHFINFIFPFLFFLFPNYEPANNAFKLIALTSVIYLNAFGYPGLLIAKSKEHRLAILAFFSLCLNIILDLLIVHLKFPFSMVVIGTMVTYFIYVFFLGYFGRKELNMGKGLIYILKDLYPLRLSIPFLLSVFFILTGMQNIYFIIPFLLVVLLNVKTLIQGIELIKVIIQNPDCINI